MDLYTTLSGIRFLVIIKQSIDKVELKLFRSLQIVGKYFRQVIPGKQRDSLEFAILCVKRPIYIELAIQNVNSLHFYNPSHRVTFYVDKVCKEALKTSLNNLDYPEQIQIITISSKSNQPWQLSKVDVLIEASKNNQILIDADGIWRSNPEISHDKVTFLVKAYPFRVNEAEIKLLLSLKNGKKLLSYNHYVTGFVSIPANFMTSQLADSCRQRTREILRSEDASIRRLAEEIGVSIAVQLHVKKNAITTLKDSDGPGSRYILQSLYYGCSNKIIQ